eukprot:4798607-Amphidinium_carterae.1
MSVMFQVTSCSKPLLSLGKLWRQGQIQIQTHAGQLFICIGENLLPVHVLGNTLYIKVRVGAQQVSGLDDEEMGNPEWEHPEAFKEAQLDEAASADREVQVGIYDEGDPRALAAEYGPIHIDIEGGEPGHTWASRVVDIRQ